MIGGIISNQGICVHRLDSRNRKFNDPEKYHILWMADGVTGLKVNHEPIQVFQNTIALIAPGSLVSMTLTCHPAPLGWTLSFPGDYFLERPFDNLKIKDLFIYNGGGKVPVMVLSPKIGIRVNALAEMIAELNASQIPNREDAVASLLNTLLIYCDSKCNVKVNPTSNSRELNIVGKYKQLVAGHFREKHQVSDYAGMMYLSPKYLNQVIKKVMGVSAKSVIQEQLLIKACRELKFSGESIKEIAANLGFSEPEHFSHFFKKATGQAPSQYREI